MSVTLLKPESLDRLVKAAKRQGWLEGQTSAMRIAVQRSTSDPRPELIALADAIAAVENPY